MNAAGIQSPNETAMDGNAAGALLRQVWDLNCQKVARLHGSALMVRTAEGHYVLKRHAEHCTPNRDGLARIYAAVSAAGLSPAMVTLPNGGVFWEGGGCLYSLQVHGVSCAKAPTPAATGEWLARLHDCLAAVEGAPVANHLDRLVPDVPQGADEYCLTEATPFLGEAESLHRHRQPVHGDLHRGNLLFTAKAPLAIDFDSATGSHPALDVGFAAYRLFGADPDAFRGVALAYTKSRPEAGVSPRTAALMLLHAVVQRIVFILRTAAKGDGQWLYDLDRQQRYHRDALSLVNHSQRCSM
ncbi:MAG: hypothetical protein BM485_03130 [Desulfobulbaceae bacterium DB1]|nr:MAG: hypothetical protein BM485_03130 [Desulfobulbaceae bacterium DB1]